MGRAANIAFFIPHAGCPHACSFCDQRGISGVAAAPSPAEVSRTLAAARARMGTGARDAEVAFFGGSFTAIPRAQMLAYLEAAAPFLGRGGFAGVRLSTRPDAVDDETLALLAARGVTAVELGAQSMDDAVLHRNRRGHTAAQVADAATRVKAAGFSLALQMMTGLPGDTWAGARRTARLLAALRPDAVRIYPALTLRGTQMAGWWRTGDYLPQTLEEAVALCAALYGYFERRGVHVLRVGLHAQPSLEQNLLAGPWHPAFGELCENRVYRSLARRALAQLPAGTRAATLYAPAGALSKLIGQHRVNMARLTQISGLRLRAAEDAALSPLQVRACAVQEGKPL